MLHVVSIYWDWHLVRTESTFDWCSFPSFWSSPTFRNTSNQDRVYWLSCFFCRTFTSFCLDFLDFFNRFVQFFCKQSMSCFMVVRNSRYVCKNWFPSKTFKEKGQFFVCFAFEDCWIVDLSTVEVEDWKNSTIIDWVQEGIGQPTSHQWTSFPFTITDYGCGNHIWIVQNSSRCVRKSITKFSTFVDRSWCFRRRVRGNPSWE